MATADRWLLPSLRSSSVVATREKNAAWTRVTCRFRPGLQRLDDRPIPSTPSLITIDWFNSTEANLNATRSGYASLTVS
jgi:hypothetical protein